MNEPKRFSAILLGIIAIIVIMLAFDSRAQDHPCQGGHNCNEGGIVDVDLVGGDNVINGGRSYGVAGSDYDIGQCMYHAGGLTIAIGFRNKFCEGMDMIRSGMVNAGVLHICKQTKIGRNYDSLKDCKDGLVVVGPPLPPAITSDDDEEDERIDVLYALFSDLEAQRNEDVAKAKKDVQRANAAAHRAQMVQQVPDDAAERRAKARAAMKGEQ